KKKFRSCPSPTGGCPSPAAARRWPIGSLCFCWSLYFTAWPSAVFFGSGQLAVAGSRAVPKSRVRVFVFVFVFCFCSKRSVFVSRNKHAVSSIGFRPQLSRSFFCCFFFSSDSCSADMVVAVVQTFIIDFTIADADQRAQRELFGCAHLVAHLAGCSRFS